jgi:DNA gyrase subunit A
MGRGTGGVRGMNVSRGKNWVLAMDVAVDETELLVVTENGYGKRTAIADYPRKGRGTMGVKTIQLTDTKGGLAAALIVREHQELVFMSVNGMVQRTGVRGISCYGRASQGVKLMNIKDDDRVSAVALVVEDSAETAAQVAAEDGPVDAGETTAQPPHIDPAQSDDAVVADAEIEDDSDE